MDGKNGLILWVLGGAGILFLYSAYTKKSPQAVLASTLGGPLAPTATQSSGGGSASPPVSRESVDGGPVSFSTAPDSTGLNYLFDLNGNMAGVVPNAYQTSPNTYIPPRGAVSV